MNSSMTETTATGGADLSPASWPVAVVRSIVQGISWIDARRRLQRDVRELMALDDRILRDVGLNRSEIDYALRYGRDFDRYRDRLRR